MRRVPPFFLGFLAFNNIVRGTIHCFAPDGGAHSIAGLDLSTNAQTILSLFAEMGFHQLALALFQIFVLVFRRDLLVIALALQAVETAFGVFNLLFWRTLPVEVPGAYFNTALLPVLLAVLAMAVLGERRPALSSQT